MSDTVLHVGKVSGHLRLRSASAHAPARLAGAGLGRPLLPPARGRAGSVGLRRPADRRRRPCRRHPAPARCRSARLLAAASRRAPQPAVDPPHASRPRRRLRPPGGQARARAGAREHEARLQHLPRAARVRARRPRARGAGGSAHRHLRRSRPLPRRDGGLRRVGLRGRPLRHRAPGPSRRHRSGRAEAALRRPARPDQGSRDAPAGGSRRRGAPCPASSSRSRATGRCARSSRRARDSSGSTSAVRFLGRVPEIGPAYERAAVVVVPSLGEGFGMARSRRRSGAGP